MKKPLIALVAIAILGAAAFIAWKLGPEKGVTNIPDPIAPMTFERDTAGFEAKITFVDITEAAGVRFKHESGARGRKLLPETMGGGCAFIDFDRDGDQDLFFVNSTQWPDDPDAGKATHALYENNGSGSFTDVTKAKGLDESAYGMGAAIGDFDGDGWDDLLVTAVGTDRLYRNDAGARFVDVTEKVGLPISNPESFEEGPHPWSSSAAFLDYDGDGRLDLFVCRYIGWSPAYDLAQGFQITGIGRAYGPPTKFEGTLSRLYRNTGSGFEDVSRSAGVEVRNPHTDKPLGKSLAVCVFDMDRDGWVDMVVANDTVQNFLFHNQRDGTFREIGVDAGVAFDNSGNTRGAMGIDWEQLDSSGTQGIVVGNFANEITALYVSDDPMTYGFTDDAEPLGIGNPSRKYMKFGVFFFDLDLDGRLDILESNGHLENEIATVQAEQSYEQPVQIFWSAGSKARRPYEELRAEQLGAEIFKPMVGRGCAYGDIDGDGDLDIVVVGNNMPARLYRNDGGHAGGFVRLKLRGKGPNTNAFGARVEAVVKDETIHAKVVSGRSYLSQCEQVVTIGLGGAASADELRIFWPGKTEAQSLGAIPAGEQREVIQE